MPQRKAEYRVAFNSSLTDLCEEVDNLMAEGFVTNGPLVVNDLPDGETTWYYQPMLRPAGFDLKGKGN